MVKTVGSLAIFFSFALCGAFIGDKKKRAVRECEAFLDLFIYTKGQISCFLAPTKLIWHNAKNKYLESIGFMAELLTAEDDEVYCDAFSKAFERYKSGFSMSGEAMELIRSFGEKIGKSGEDEQVTNIEYYIAELRRITEKERDMSKRDAKLYMTLGISLGLIVFILLI